MPAGSLRGERQSLLDDPGVGASTFGAAYAAAADEWLAALAHETADGVRGHWALLAVGGYGRGELAPYSDLDLVFVHDGARPLVAAAERLWYPIWDEGVGLDHSVRTPKEVLGAARADLRVALGLLDARLVAGDAELAAATCERIRRAWVEELCATHLDALADSMAQRHARADDLAFLLEPDLKECRGGLRDAAALHALGRFASRLSGAVDLDGVAEAERVVREIRVALQRTTRRSGDRLVFQDQDAVAASFGVQTPDLLRALSGAGRLIASAIDVAWRRRRRWDPSTPAVAMVPRALADGVVELDGEAALADDARADLLGTLALAATAARHALPVAPESARRAAAALREGEAGPWPDGAADLLVATLARGEDGLVALESLDLAGALPALLPEWVPLRHFHQRNPYHRFTADRHLLEAAKEAAALTDRVIRPQVLLLGALLHDVGKGRGGDHTELGVELAREVTARMGLDDQDAVLVVDMVRQHLLLPDTAVRRDLSDPATVAMVAERVGSPELLELLAALAVADGRATGPSAWTAWKARQVALLVELTHAALLGGALEVPAASGAQVAAAGLARRAQAPIVQIDGDRLVLACPDRPGLLAAAAGVLCLAGLDLRSVDARTLEGIAVDEFDVSPGPRGMPRAEAVEAELLEVLAGRRDLASAIDARDRDYRRRGAARTQVAASADQAASGTSTVIEVRAPDRLGLLWRLAATISATGLSISAARAVSLGHEAIDVFYVRDARGGKLDGPALDALLIDLAVAGTPEDAR